MTRCFSRVKASQLVNDFHTTFVFIVEINNFRKLRKCSWRKWHWWDQQKLFPFFALVGRNCSLFRIKIFTLMVQNRRLFENIVYCPATLLRSKGKCLLIYTALRCVSIQSTAAVFEKWQVALLSFGSINSKLPIAQESSGDWRQIMSSEPLSLLPESDEWIKFIVI